MFSMDINVFHRPVFRIVQEGEECTSNSAKTENMYSSAVSGSLFGTKINITHI